MFGLSPLTGPPKRRRCGPTLRQYQMPSCPSACSGGSAGCGPELGNARERHDGSAQERARGGAAPPAVILGADTVTLRWSEKPAPASFPLCERHVGW